eukprot:CAMPEP_0175278066 /NCGR_PEP_ID=MMETSP0093-20121207/49329_1 /TAXON_ID=311494 /ORGANISM="Alexandrium monilatum, Strain CCMP3105" /LENGTH=542 /DNA_ID=CAMNT_0016573035 /DNA_START=12 /DNA_END=1640 /DNA_ORIENTATION=+
MAEADAGSRIEGRVQPWPGMPHDDFLKLPFPQPQKKMTPKKLTEICEKNLPGEFSGMLFPHSPEQIEEWGPEWLTKALHHSKSIPEDVTVTSFTSFRVLAGDTTKATDNADDSNWGGAGIKVMLSVEYSKPAGDATQHFFIKIPHKMGNKSERHKVSILLNNDFPEVMFNVLFVPQAPFKCPRCYFADINRETTNYIVIQERLFYSPKKESYAPGELLPAPGKYLDYQLESKGAEHYYALAKAFARMAAWYQETIKISPQLDYLFLVKDHCDYLQGERANDKDFYGPLETRMDFIKSWISENGEETFWTHVCAPATTTSESLARGMLDFAEEFMKNCAGLFPKGVLTPAFKKQIMEEAQEWAACNGFCNYIITKAFWELHVLSHPNLQIDNAFYWRDDAGKMQSGLLDFGSICHSSIPHVLAGSWSGAEVEVMDEHEDKMCDAFVDAMTEAGGQCCTKKDFRVLLKLARGSGWAGSFINFPKLYQLVPPKELATIKSRHDPRIEGAFLVRCYGYGVVLTTAGWKSRNPTPYLRQLRTELGLH